MLISIIIPAFNEEKFIGQCLQSILLLNKSTFDYEVIVVDNGSSDNTVEIAKESGANVLIKSEGNVSAVRNYGAKSAKGEFLAFVDSDCIVSQDWLANAVDSLAKNNVDAVGAFPESPPNSGWIAKVLQENAKNKVGENIKYLPACNVIVKSDVFWSVGGFNEELETNEDVDFSAKLVAAGYRIFADKNLKVCHLDVPLDLSGFIKREIWHGKNALSVFLESVKQVRNLKVILYSLAFAFLILLFPISLMAILFYNNYALILIAISILLLISCIMSWRIFKEKKSPLLLFLAYDMIYGLGRGISVIYVLITKFNEIFFFKKTTNEK